MPPHPDHFSEAPTRRDVLFATTRADTPELSKYRYYELPIRRFLHKLGCPADDLDDLVQEALILLHTRLLDTYEPERGPFRPYLKQALRNLLREHFRKQHRDQPISEPPASATDRLVDDELLTERLRAIFDRYMREVVPPDGQQAAEVLAERLTGTGQKQIAARLGCSERWVRSLQERAAGAFWQWARARFHPDDWARLVPPQLASASSGSALVRWLSRRKRRELAAVLIALFNNEPVAGE